MMLLNCMAIATMCLQGSSNAQDFVPEGIEIFTMGVPLAKIDTGDVVAARHCSSLLDRAKVEHGFMDSTYFVRLQTSGPSSILVFKSDVDKARAVLQDYAATGYVTLVGQEHAIAAQGYKPIAENSTATNKERATLISEVTSDFAKNVGNIYGLEIRGIALRQRKYFCAAEDQVLSVGYDALVTASETASFATSVYHIQCLADLSLTNWNRVKTFAGHMPTADSTFVPSDLPNIIDGRDPVVSVSFFDSISKRHIESVLKAANFDAVESTSVRTTYYVFADDLESATKLLHEDNSLREYAEFPGQYRSDWPESMPTPSTILNETTIKRDTSLREIDEQLRLCFFDLAPKGAKITRLGYKKRRYFVSPNVQGFGYECFVEYRTASGQHYEWSCQVLADHSIRWAMPTSIGR
jgi:hypothetical protein